MAIIMIAYDNNNSLNKSSAVPEKRRHASVGLFIICSAVMVQFGS